MIDENNSPSNLPSSSIKPLLNPMNPFDAINKKATASKNKIIDVLLSYPNCSLTKR